MTRSTALEFHGDMLMPVLMEGFGFVGVYGLIAVSIVLSYKISRTVAFVHGGILLFGTLFYWYFTFQGPHLGHWPALLLCVVIGAAIAVAYGFAITSERLSNYPKVTLTTFSLGIMLLLAGLCFTIVAAQGELVDSVFGEGTIEIMNGFLSHHDLAALIILGAFVVGLNIVMKSTRFGIFMRAIADNVEASRLVGVPMSKVGIIVYAMTGAISALGGVLIATSVGTDKIAILLIFIRALMICVLGAFGSIPLALLGAFIIGTLETALTGQVFGDLGSGGTEFILIAVLFGAVLVIDRFGKQDKQVLQSESM